jgi:adenosylcobinamide kinase / adenosylcobinamide-phosphate guanylyltransferase
MTQQRNAELILLTGGARSGKSRHALDLAAGRAGPRGFVATAEPFDDEMRERIAAHRLERAPEYVTVEAPLALAPALTAAVADHGLAVAVVDCLTVWLGNLLHHRDLQDAHTPLPEVDALLTLLDHPPCDLILVTNELGMGIVPENPLARAFRDRAGWLNQEVARRAHYVTLLVSGCPLPVKTPNPNPTPGAPRP